MYAIHIQNLIKVYANGTKALKGIDLKISIGDFFALLGANGAGKTTIIGILTGVVTKTSGHVQIFDYNIDTDHTKAKKLIGVVPQEFNFNLFEKVQDILVSQAGYFGIERKIALKDAAVILKRLELWAKKEVPARMLSGGMKRRLMIARALIHKPKLLILDEPTAGVDVELRHGMWEYLRELNRGGTTILLTTHYLEEVEQMCRHAAIIKNGEIIKNDRVKNLLQLLDEETYIISVKQLHPLRSHFATSESSLILDEDKRPKRVFEMASNKFKNFESRILDDSTIEVEVIKPQTLNDFIVCLAQDGIEVTDIRPKGNRMEKLYLKIMKT